MALDIRHLAPPKETKNLSVTVQLGGEGGRQARMSFPEDVNDAEVKHLVRAVLDTVDMIQKQYAAKNGVISPTPD